MKWLDKTDAYREAMAATSFSPSAAVGEYLGTGLAPLRSEPTRMEAETWLERVIGSAAATVASWTGEAVHAVNMWSKSGLFISAAQVMQRRADPAAAVDFATGRLLIGASQRRYLRSAERDEIRGAVNAYRIGAERGGKVARFEAWRYARAHLASTIATIRGREAVLQDWPGWAGYFKIAEASAATPEQAAAFLANTAVSPLVRAAFGLGWAALQREPVPMPFDIAAMVAKGRPHLAKVWKLGEHVERAGAAIDAMAEGMQESSDAAEHAEMPSSEAAEMFPSTGEGVSVSVKVEPASRADGLNADPEGASAYGVRSQECRPHSWEVSRLVEKSRNLVQQLSRLAWEGRDTYERERGQEAGTLDEGALHRLATEADPRVFERPPDEGRQSVAVGLLVDCSGSMGAGTDTGTRVSDAKAVAFALVQAFRNNPRVRFNVAGHDVNYRHGRVVTMYECPKPESIAGLDSGGDNADGFAIATMAKRLAGAPEPRKLLVLLADGFPSARGYGRGAGRKHVRAMADAAERAGVQFLALGVEGCIDPGRARDMYGPGRFLEIGNARTAGPLLVRKLSAILRGGGA